MLSKPLYPLGYQPNEIQNVFLYKDPTIEENKKTNVRKKKAKEDIPIVLNQSDFFNKNICLNNYKLPELKVIAKHNKIPLAGSKQILIEKIENFFFKDKCSTKIQTAYKTYIIRKCYELRGDAIHNRTLCVNGSDFYSLEPINEINPLFFFSYKDEKNFIYGFDLCSLISLIKNNTTNNKYMKTKNPYNRENITSSVLEKIQTIYKLVRIIFNGLEELNELPYCPPQKENNRLNRFRQLHHSNQSVEQQNNRINNSVLSPEEREIYVLYVERNVENLLLFDEFTNRYNKMVEIRERPLETRVNQLFMEIDQLGNYTSALWFLNLERREYIRFYRSLYDIWMYRAQLSFDTKKRICVLEDPFTNSLGQGQSIFMNDISLERIKGACLRVFENLIYTGIDRDYRKLGSFHALTALTMVSRTARETMPWLYESIVF